ncbi:hypothetical protein [Paenibacillus roseipurpureus]|uniref:Uncharacterized protein n=1 Tax=Paenibacillus roseopurpureus TaxID=2918901 RepID=A0AA96LQC2_9BACL|nr:hypothetical protein [Paenibacillus sp. MBLB1832]WNR45346.1 hypothetical protein MJB10_04195 [Paenibacillus sp. MBLB1832]
MKQTVVVLFLLGSVLISPKHGQADVPMPCSTVLEAINEVYPNAKGAALVYKVKLTPSFPRTSLSIHANHLPPPTSLGAYDGFEGFAFIPNEISWRFRLYPTPIEGGPWSGKVDDITAELSSAQIEVRLSNSQTGVLGPAVLRSSRACR